MWHRNPDISSMSLSQPGPHFMHSSVTPYPGPSGVMFRYPSSCCMCLTARPRVATLVLMPHQFVPDSDTVDAGHAIAAPLGTGSAHSADGSR